VAGPAAALDVVDGLVPQLRGYAQLPVVRADLLRRLGRAAESAVASAEAAELAGSEPERRFLERVARTSPSEMSDSPDSVARDTS